MELGHVYAPSQLQNSYVPPKITDHMKVWPAQSSRKIKAAHILLAPLVQVIMKERNTWKPGKKVASPDYVGAKWGRSLLVKRKQSPHNRTAGRPLTPVETSCSLLCIQHYISKQQYYAQVTWRLQLTFMARLLSISFRDSSTALIHFFLFDDSWWILFPSCSKHCNKNLLSILLKSKYRLKKIKKRKKNNNLGCQWAVRCYTKQVTEVESMLWTALPQMRNLPKPCQTQSFQTEVHSFHLISSLLAEGIPETSKQRLPSPKTVGQCDRLNTGPWALKTVDEKPCLTLPMQSSSCSILLTAWSWRFRRLSARCCHVLLLASSATAKGEMKIL